VSELLRVQHLTMSFGGLAVTRDVSLALAPGERVALIGPNGAGKTTFVNLVTGHLRPSSGTILLAGQDITRLGPTKRVRLGLVRSFQVSRLFLDMTPEEHVALAVLRRRGLSGRMFGSHRRMPEVVAEVEDILATLGLSDLAGRKVAGIAYGQQRLIELALAMALRPKALLLDEPAAGLPQAETGRIERALDRLPPELAVLMIDHDMNLIFRFARRVVVMAAGRIIFDGPPAAAIADAAVRQAYLGSYADARGAA
jgi:branched-chain amino acid transport system ATP-binding protein